MAVSFKLRAEPKEPIRETVSHRLPLYDDCSVSELIEVMKEYNLAPSDIKFRYESSYYDSVDYYFEFSALETEKSYQKRVRRYQRLKKAYDTWYAQNCDAIEVELKKRKLEATQKELKEKQKEKLRLQEELSIIQKKISKYEESNPL